jgi:hypothetical protein
VVLLILQHAEDQSLEDAIFLFLRLQLSSSVTLAAVESGS